jgi:hypothetical protein
MKTYASKNAIFATHFRVCAGCAGHGRRHRLIERRQVEIPEVHQLEFGVGAFGGEVVCAMGRRPGSLVALMMTIASMILFVIALLSIAQSLSTPGMTGQMPMWTVADDVCHGRVAPCVPAAAPRGGSFGTGHYTDPEDGRASRPDRERTRGGLGDICICSTVARQVQGGDRPPIARGGRKARPVHDPFARTDQASTGGR